MPAQICAACQQGNVIVGVLLGEHAKTAVAALQHHFGIFTRLLQ